MNIIALGDIHGRTIWKDIVSNEKFDKIVFIGDYFDTHEDISAVEQIQNFKNIIEYKRNAPDKVILLFGNHDFHYLRSVNEQYAGYQHWQRADIGELLHNALDNNLMQMCYRHNKFLFSHAGVTNTWCINNNIGLPPLYDNIDLKINDLFIYTPRAFKFTVGTNHDVYGDDVTQTPIWVRPSSLKRDNLLGFTQVVGHTFQDKMSITDDIILIDTLGSSKEYLYISDDMPVSRKLSI